MQTVHSNCSVLANGVTAVLHYAMELWRVHFSIMLFIWWSYAINCNKTLSVFQDCAVYVKYIWQDGSFSHNWEQIESALFMYMICRPGTCVYSSIMLHQCCYERWTWQNILMAECRSGGNSCALAVVLLQSCAEPLIDTVIVLMKHIK